MSIRTPLPELQTNKVYLCRDANLRAILPNEMILHSEIILPSEIISSDEKASENNEENDVDDSMSDISELTDDGVVEQEGYENESVVRTIVISSPLFYFIVLRKELIGDNTFYYVLNLNSYRFKNFLNYANPNRVQRGKDYIKLLKDILQKEDFDIIRPEEYPTIHEPQYQLRNNTHIFASLVDDVIIIPMNINPHATFIPLYKEGNDGAISSLINIRFGDAFGKGGGTRKYNYKKTKILYFSKSKGKSKGKG